MLTFLFLEAYLVSRWHQISLKYLWAKFTSCLHLSSKISIPLVLTLKYENERVSLKDKPTDKLRKAEMSIEDKFQAAVRVIHSLPKDGMLLFVL